MPSLNLRLSDVEHELLVGWAESNGRSLQREIVWRLFGGPGVRVPLDAVSGFSPAAPLPVVVREFRGPDLKVGLAAGDGEESERRSPSSQSSSPAASSCPGDAPAGTRCKLCGKKH